MRNIENNEELEAQGFKQVKCPCCGGTKTEIIYGKPYKESAIELPKKCECK